MSRITPPLRECPYCRTDAESVERVNVVDNTRLGDLKPKPGVTDEIGDVTTCLRFNPCGHAFEKDSIEAVLDAQKKLRKAKQEKRRSEDPDRIKELKEYEIPAKTNAVMNRIRDAVRREEAEVENPEEEDDG